MWAVRMLLLLLVVVLVTGFSALNADQTVSVSLGTIAYHNVSLILLMWEAFILGAVVWFLVSIFHEIQLRRRIREQRREISDLHSEIAGLRQMSLDEIEEDDTEG